METKTTLWFSIEETFSHIFALCVEARAAELVVQQQATEARTARRVATGNTLLDSIGPPPLTDERHTQAAELARDQAFRESHAHGADLVQLRGELRASLGRLRSSLAEVLNEHDVYHVLFPVVVYCDELLASATRGAATRWEPMQGEFYEIENGGEAFYELVEQLLKQDETHPLVFETFYFCLLDGFTGMYPAGSKKIEDVKAQLLARFSTPKIKFPELGLEPRRVSLVPFPWRYYVGAGLAILGVYVALSWMAGT